jgi:predicted PurR-regulated permease PerM
VLSGWRRTRTAFRSLWPPLALAAASAAVVGAVVWFLSTGESTASLKVLVGLLGGLGLSTAATAGLVAKAKSTAQQLITRLRQDAYSDLVAIAVTSIPNHPDTDATGTECRVRDAVANRPVTPATPMI